MELIEEFDNAPFPVFLPAYMILYASYYSNSFGDHYEYHSIADIYKMSSINNLDQKFNYIGRINSKNRSIRELYRSNNKNSFLMKIYNKQNEFNNSEITIVHI